MTDSLRDFAKWVSEQRWNEEADLDDICTRADQALRTPELIGDQRSGALQDSAYIAGAKAGYNLGLSENHEGLQAIVDGRQGYLAVLSSPPPPSDTGEVERLRLRAALGNLLANIEQWQATDDIPCEAENHWAIAEAKSALSGGIRRGEP